MQAITHIQGPDLYCVRACIFDCNFLNWFRGTLVFRKQKLGLCGERKFDLTEDFGGVFRQKAGPKLGHGTAPTQPPWSQQTAWILMQLKERPKVINIKHFHSKYLNSSTGQTVATLGLGYSLGYLWVWIGLGYSLISGVTQNPSAETL